MSRLINKIINRKNNKQKEKKKDAILQRFGNNNNIDLSARYDDYTTVEGYAIVRRSADISSAKIGLGSLIGVGCEFRNAKIGRFCSTATNVKVIDATHPTDLVSTNISFYNTVNDDVPFGKSSFEFPEFLTTDNGYSVEIGNDVWLGTNALIKGGVKIGDGAIVAMGAVVTKDVPPYAIVGGVPAKVIKYRFDEKTIKALLDIKWWDWDAETVKARREEFSDTVAFIKKYAPPPRGK